jgi:DNA-binding LacI/PurR family transcriptional regulator
VEIVSCDHEKEMLSLMRPSPASIDLHRQTIARLAVERLFWRMRNGMTSPSVVITVSPTLGNNGGAVAAAEDGTSE